MTALAAARQSTSARDAAAIGRDLAHVLAWLWHSYVIVIQAFAHHEVPPITSTVPFAVTFTAVMAFVFRRRRHTTRA